MMNLFKKIILISVIFISLFLSNAAFSKSNLPSLFLFLGGDDASKYKNALENSCVSGAQIIYTWKQLEPTKGFYDFSKIKDDLIFLNKMHKKLFIQLQDRSFEPTRFNVPDYIREEQIYHGGVAMEYDSSGAEKPIIEGSVARVWDTAVRERFHLLIKKLGAEFDGKIAGINLPETAVDFDPNNPPSDFTPDKYFQGEIINMKVLRKAFDKSKVVQYVNFFPAEWNNDHHYMSRLFFYAMKHQIGLGGPDVIPYRKAQMDNSYPFFHQFQDKILTAIAIQEPDYTFKNPKTGDYYHFFDFYDFTQNYLGADIIFWNVQEPFFSSELIPNLNFHNFECH